MEIKIGDVVVLKSGGPKMVVEQIGNFGMGNGPKDEALCKWFIEDELKEQIFKLTSLNIV